MRDGGPLNKRKHDLGGVQKRTASKAEKETAALQTCGFALSGLEAFSNESVEGFERLAVTVLA
jgi:hypothetical protein